MDSRNWSKRFANELNSVVPYGLDQDVSGNTMRPGHCRFLSSPTPYWLLLRLPLKEVLSSKLFCLSLSCLPCCRVHSGGPCCLIGTSYSSLFLFVALCLRIRKQGFKSRLGSHFKTAFNDQVSAAVTSALFITICSPYVIFQVFLHSGKKKGGRFPRSWRLCHNNDHW